MDDSAVIVLTSLIEDKGARVFALDGFSVEEMEFLSSFCSLEQCISNIDWLFYTETIILPWAWLNYPLTYNKKIPWAHKANH